MPELPGEFVLSSLRVSSKADLISCVCAEVERAAKFLRDISLGKKIVKVDAVEDAIVFSGTTHEQFVSAEPLSGT